jgi:kinesin family member 5
MHTLSQPCQSHVNVRTPERALDFSYDRVFTSGATQADVYASVRHVILGVMDGFNGTLLTYGQTSSGKTHTMMGRMEGGKGGQEGIIPRAVAELFSAVQDSKESLEFTFKCSYVEIYCERVRDLLDPVPGQDLQVRQDPQEGVVVQGATEGEFVFFYLLLIVVAMAGGSRTVARRVLSVTRAKPRARRAPKQQ